MAIFKCCFITLMVVISFSLVDFVDATGPVVPRKSLGDFEAIESYSQNAVVKIEKYEKMYLESTDKLVQGELLYKSYNILKWWLMYEIERINAGSEDKDAIKEKVINNVTDKYRTLFQAEMKWEKSAKSDDGDDGCMPRIKISRKLVETRMLVMMFYIDDREMIKKLVSINPLLGGYSSIEEIDRNKKGLLSVLNKQRVSSLELVNKKENKDVYKLFENFMKHLDAKDFNLFLGLFKKNSSLEAKYIYHFMVGRYKFNKFEDIANRAKVYRKNDSYIYNLRDVFLYDNFNNEHSFPLSLVLVASDDGNGLKFTVDLIDCVLPPDVEKLARSVVEKWIASIRQNKLADLKECYYENDIDSNELMKIYKGYAKCDFASDNLNVELDLKQNKPYFSGDLIRAEVSGISYRTGDQLETWHEVKLILYVKVLDEKPYILRGDK